MLPAHLASYAQNLSNTLLKKGKDGPTNNGCPLSERELEVLRELSQGHSNKMIARNVMHTIVKLVLRAAA
jgi:DNA-binding NarL/FixJ family response regulator